MCHKALFDDAVCILLLPVIRQTVRLDDRPADAGKIGFKMGIVMRNLLGVTTAAFLMCNSGGATAATLDLDFSFEGLSGTIFGLDDTDGTSSATSISFNGAYDTYVLNEFDANSFEFLDGELVFVFFAVLGFVTGSQSVSELALLECDIDFCFLDEMEFSVQSDFVEGPVSYSVPEVSSVPLPAGGSLLLGSLALLLTARRKLRQTA